MGAAAAARDAAQEWRGGLGARRAADGRVLSAAETDVLVVGGGPVGLAAALALARSGVRTTLVEQHVSVHPHPRARAIGRRSMEIFRALGIEAEVEGIGLPPEWTREVVYTRTLAGEELARIATADFDSALLEELSPSHPVLTSQDRLEPVLREALEKQPSVETRYGCRLVDLEQDGEAALAKLDGERGGTLRARWVLAADGAASPLRSRLGIELEGARGLATILDVHFCADFSRFTAHRPGPLFWVDHELGAGVFQPIDGAEIWRAQIQQSPQIPGPDAFGEGDALRWLHAALGVPPGQAPAIEVLEIRPWTLHAADAERYRKDRVLLVGDAAHVLPPTGGLGMNTGILGAFSLGWKLAAVLAGQASEALLDSYQTEHQPIARRNIGEALANARAVGGIVQAVRGGGDLDAALAEAKRYGNHAGLDLGYLCEQGAFVPDGAPAPPGAGDARAYLPDARPGRRAPHVWIEREGERISTLDLFGPHLTLLAAREGQAWLAAGAGVAQRRGLSLACHALCEAAGRVYGLGGRGAALVRPDGLVAWRAPTAAPDPEPALERALDEILGRDG